MKHHLKHMAIGAGAILAVLLLFRVELGTALPYALLLACPLGMVGMMVMMDRSKGGGHQHGAGCHDADAGASESSTALQPDAPDPAADGESRTRENHERIP
jgi:hypothetical protein